MLIKSIFFRRIALPLLVISLLKVDVSSQEILFERSMGLSTYQEYTRESFPMLNEKNEVALFLLEKKILIGILFDKDYIINKDFTDIRTERKYKILLGGSIDGYTYTLFFANGKISSLYTKTIDFYTKESHGKILPVKLKNEKFLECASVGNHFYFLTVMKRSSVIKIYVFEGDELNKIVEIDLSDYKFSNSGFTKLYDVLNDKSKLLAANFNIQKVDNNCHNPIDITHKHFKAYCFNNKFFFTMDNDLEHTKILTIDLGNFEHNVKFYDQKDIFCGHVYNIGTNSFLSGDLLFQIKECRYELYYSVYDIQKDTLLKETSVKKDEPITFNNSSLYLERIWHLYSMESLKELEETDQFLRRLSETHIGISVYPKEDTFEVILGGYVETVGDIFYKGSMNSISGLVIDK